MVWVAELNIISAVAQQNNPDLQLPEEIIYFIVLYVATHSQQSWQDEPEKKPFVGNRIIFDEGWIQTAYVLEALGCQFGFKCIIYHLFPLKPGLYLGTRTGPSNWPMCMLSPVSDSSNQLHKSHRAKQMPCDDRKMSCQICLCEIFTMYHLCDMKSVTLKV